MGAPMAEVLARRGYTVTVYNRTRVKADALRAAGIRVASRPEEALQLCECAILMLSDAAAINDTLMTQSTAGLFESRTVIQMGTIGPTESRRLRDAVVARRADYLEAPVLGSIPEVRSSTLIVMVGGDIDLFERWRTLLESFGPSPIFIGPVGQAATVKLAMNQLIGSLIAAFSLSLGIALRSGVDAERLMSVLRRSALYAPTFDKKFSRLIHREYSNPNFPLKHLQKDIHLFIQEGAALGLSTDWLAALDRALVDALRRAHLDDDYAAINEMLNPSED
jgi:3-hydroxyisobutyrate dehydrogenase